MKAIRVKVPFGDRYVEAEVFNLNHCNWREFIPDSRKKQHRKAKFRPYRGVFFATAENFISQLMNCSEEPSLGIAVRQSMTEAVRRYNQRYAIFGELGNAEMPSDPEREEQINAVLEYLNKMIDHLPSIK